MSAATSQRTSFLLSCQASLLLQQLLGQRTRLRINNRVDHLLQKSQQFGIVGSPTSDLDCLQTKTLSVKSHKKSMLHFAKAERRALGPSSFLGDRSSSQCCCMRMQRPKRKEFPVLLCLSGHTLVVHTVQQQWLEPRSNSERESLLLFCFRLSFVQSATVVGNKRFCTSELHGPGSLRRLVQKNTNALRVAQP